MSVTSRPPSRRRGFSTLGYDARSRQTSTVHRASANGAILSSESDAYDDAGDLSSKAVDGTTTTYGYDAANQLTSESRTGYSASYAYDANGNRTSKTLNGVTDTYAVDDGDKLTSVTEGSTTVKSYGYDAAGRTTSVASPAGTTTLAYDYESRVTSVSGPGVSDSFTYNGLDARVGKVEASGTKTYRRDGADVTSDVLSDGAATYTPGVSQRRGGATTYDLHDRLGTAARQTDASSSVTATRTYDAFGTLVASTGTPVGPFGFAASSGYQEDGDTGLKLLGHRYYDASTGRFLTRDPVKDGRNWYAYCENDPLTGVDPTGYDDGTPVLPPLTAPPIRYPVDPPVGHFPRPTPGPYDPGYISPSKPGPGLLKPIPQSPTSPYTDVPGVDVGPPEFQIPVSTLPGGGLRPGAPIGTLPIAGGGGGGSVVVGGGTVTANIPIVSRPGWVITLGPIFHPGNEKDPWGVSIGGTIHWP